MVHARARWTGARPFATAAVLGFAGAAWAQPRCAYTVRFDPAAPETLEVTLEASGLAPGDWSLVLDGWGNWPEMEGEYIEVGSSHPPVGERDGTKIPLRAPEGWDGSVHLAYTVRVLGIGSPEQRARTILPAAGETYMTGALANTIARLYRNGEPADLEPTITIEGPREWTVFTGWAGGAEGSQESRLPAPGENAVFAIGRPVDVRTGAAGDVPCEVYQFAPGEGAASKALGITRTFVAHVSSTLEHTPPGPVRVCITGTTGGGYLTDHGLVVGLPDGSPEWLLDSPYYRHLVCHELFHIWLGHTLREAESEGTVWFKEGFTDYLSLWHAAACGVLPREWLATRMLEIESGARGSAFGTVPFADPSIEWRDGDGPFETMAYKGGAVLAFALDAELRSAGRPGLPAMLRAMIESGEHRYSTESIVERVRAMGLAEFERRHISGSEAPSVRDALLALGFDERDNSAQLAYIGLRTEEGAGFGRVVEIDPDGPGASAGFRVGDVIGGLAPAREDGVVAGESVDTRFTFGLTLIAPTEEPVSVWVHREGAEPVELRVVPRLIVGGVGRELRLTPKAERALFGEHGFR